MRRPNHPFIRQFAWLACASLSTVFAQGMTVSELQKQLAQGEKIAVVDVRATDVYSHRHIPGAINIPASLIPYRNVPPLGRVIRCGAGLGRDAMEAAAIAMARKPGVRLTSSTAGTPPGNQHTP